ncbi:MAG: hypothetical protein D6707_06095 [Bacteroidetes bacterium]|nr:MAG: hypothetical protein D6707_06095 [Bacteroidota bacterium]
MQFTPYTDMYNSEGVRYYYWDDGTIRNMSQNASNASSASVIKRDYNYETPIQDTASYTVSAQTFLLPVTIGLKYQLTPNIQSRIAASYYWTFTDDLDGYRAYNNYDRFFNLSVALHYTFGKIERRNKQYKHINFGEIYHEDSDGDGVEDATDKCQKTPIDVKVDADGCPLDEDEDGVPDYMDDEPHTPKGNPVNAHGVTITDEMFEQMALLRDSAVTTRTVTFYEKPTMDILRKIDQQIREHRKQMARIKAQTVLPEKFKFADENNDGIIQSNEIIAVIDGFLDGTYDISLDTVYELIDYFFEQ